MYINILLYNICFTCFIKKEKSIQEKKNKNSFDFGETSETKQKHKQKQKQTDWM